ncbi:class A beta-lactamase [Gordonia crocea]|uniref:Beta-lactamase n=1 Tax=Gordonia crocea TaxID=589162 RepID=A0A7I9V094_9ACTN|nr:class A beta-lactamase [Gordonia crocea]GED98857.1 beta-lactamase [Gordonia crocea]
MQSQWNRRELFALLGVGALVSACGTGASRSRATQVHDEFARLEDRYGARIGVHAVDVGTSAVVAHRPGETFAMCSTFKTYAAARVLQLVDAGEADLNREIPIVPDDIVVNSPVTSQAVGQTMSLRDVCAAALERSDNTAGNLMLRLIGGPAAVTCFARGIGDDASRLDRWEPELNTAEPMDHRDTTTPRALGAGYRRLLVGDVLPPAQRTQLLDWMRANTTSAKRFRAGLPAGWTSADKSGAGDYGSTNDAGLLIGPTGQRVLAVVLVRSRGDVPDAAPFNEAIAESTRLVLTHLGHRAP